jgi:PAS domain S-box-containing protein
MQTDKPGPPPLESERLASLRSLRLLDTPAEARFDRFTVIARQYFDTKISLVSLVDAERQWFKSAQGLDVRETSRDVSLCGHAILDDGILCVPDVLADPRFADNPLVTGPPHIRFYAGAPLHAPDGQRIGTLCIIDDRPRSLSAADQSMLLNLAACVDAEIANTQLLEQARELTRSRHLEDIIARAQSGFIANEDRHGAFGALLEDLLALTGSEYGFIGEIRYSNEGAPFLKTYAITDIAWDEGTRAFYQQNAPQGMEFRNLKTLFGVALASGEPVIANDAPNDPRRGGLPAGHPALNAFLGCPIRHNGELVAMFGLANRAGGYDDALLEFLGPLAATIGQLVDAARTRDLHVAAESRLQNIIDGTRIGTWEWNVQTGETWFNERWAEMAGYTLEELRPLSIDTWGALCHPDDMAYSNEVLQKHFAGELDHYDADCRMRHKEGHWIWVRDRGRVVRWTDDGKPLMMSGTHSCITEHKRTLIALEASETRLRGLFDLSPFGIALNDFETGAFIEANNALLAIIDRDRDELRQLSYFDLTPREWSEDESIIRKELETSGRYGPYEKECLRKDGSRIPVLLSGLMVYDVNGKKLNWSIIQDISAQKTHQLETAEQLDTLHTVLYQLGVATLLIDRDGTIRFATRRCDALGLDAAMLTGRHWSEALPLSANARALLERQIHMAAGERRPVEVSWRQGRRHHVLECNVRDAPDGSMGNRILSLTDISELHHLRNQLAVHRFGMMLGGSEPMRELYDRIGDVARGDWTVLIAGETGSGKELVARSIHDGSARREGPFIAVNSAGLTESLLASQLFGHRKGAFTGAFSDQVGVFESADGGTLFLDEIGDLPRGMQASLLRVLQEKEIVRVGETRPRKVDVRILAATNKDLGQEVAAGRFRQDLLYRLRVARLLVPPLRERKEDIPLLVEAFLAQGESLARGRAPRCSSAALTILLKHDWPGNVRELKATIDHALIHCHGDEIQARDLPLEISSRSLEGSQGASDQGQPSDQGEQERILAMLEHTGGNCARAAKLLGIGRATLYRRMDRLGISRRGREPGTTSAA